MAKVIPSKLLLKFGTGTHTHKGFFPPIESVTAVLCHCQTINGDFNLYVCINKAQP